MELKVKLIEGGKLPLQATDGAANFDFYARKIEMIGLNKAIIYLGVAFDIPAGYKIVFEPRSSFTHKSWIQANAPAQVDEDYKGELQLRIEAIPLGLTADMIAYIQDDISSWPKNEFIYPSLPFKEGERCCQGSLEQKIAVDFAIVEELTHSKRGVGAFGHTGVN